jgi:hypothetical protein
MHSPRSLVLQLLIIAPRAAFAAGGHGASIVVVNLIDQLINDL